MPSPTAAASSPQARLWARTPVPMESATVESCLWRPPLRCMPRAPTGGSCPQSDREAAATPAPPHPPQPALPTPARADALGGGSVYRDASLQLQFTSSLAASLQRSFFLIGALISNEFSLFFIEIPKQLWHILFVLLKTGKWRSPGEIKPQLMIYRGGVCVFPPSHSFSLMHFAVLLLIIYDLKKYFHKETLTSSRLIATLRPSQKAVPLG